MTLSAIARPSGNVLAGLFMLVAMAAFVVNDTLVKLASATLPVGEIMALRGTAAAALLIGLAWWRGALRPAATLMRPEVALRTLADIGATITYISALGSLPIANASAIFQALPLTVTMGAALVLGESVGWRRWSAIAVGFAGVMVMVRPGAEGFTLASLSVLASVVFCAVRDLATRQMPPDIPSLYVSAVTALAVALTGWALVPFGGWVRPDARHAALLGTAAVTVVIGYVFIVAAMRRGDMAVVAPLRYSMLVFALVVGLVVFGETPDGTVIAGALLVVASGVYTLARERRRGAVRSLEAERP